MSVICGVDGSQSAALAAAAGEAIAARLGVEARRVEAEPPPDRELLAAAAGARLVVVGGVGHRSGLLRLGSTAERVCEAAVLPVLVARDPAPLIAWAAGDRPLRVGVLVDEVAPGRALVRWTAGLAAVGPLEVALIHQAWPPEEQPRLGIDGPMDLVRLHPEVELARRAELGALLDEEGLSAEILLRVGWGRPADQLVSIAAEWRADLIVVGARPRSLLDRLWRGSVTHGVLQEATCNVAAVPVGWVG